MSTGRGEESGIKRVVRRGMKKHPYDTTQAQRAKLFAACNTPDITLHVRLIDLRSFSELAVDRARQLARCDKKDEARDWYRFICNSKILQILESCGVETFTLSANLKLLGLECHPLDVPSFTSDLAAIHNCLKVILSNVEKKPLHDESVGQLDPCRPGLGRTEPDRLAIENLALLGRKEEAA